MTKILSILVIIVFLLWELDIPDYFGQYSDRIWTIINILLLIGVIFVVVILANKANTNHSDENVKKMEVSEWLVIVGSVVWLIFTLLTDLLN
jgi:large-conductance mechanosensitive channel